MGLTENQKKIASSLSLILTLFSILFAYARIEDNYSNGTNLVSDVSESIHIENGYKADIIINPATTRAYAKEAGYRLNLTIAFRGIGGSIRESNYKLDLIPEKSFLEPSIPKASIPALQRDVAVAILVVSKTVVGQTRTMFINASIQNRGDLTETFSVDLYANTTRIRTHNVTLASKGSATVTSAWNTTGFAKGKYIIKSFAVPVPGETQTQDNQLIYDSVRVSILGDINGDGKVNILDISIAARAFSSKQGGQKWDCNADVNEDKQVNIVDIATIAKEYGKKDP